MAGRADQVISGDTNWETPDAKGSGVFRDPGGCKMSGPIFHIVFA